MSMRNSPSVPVEPFSFEAFMRHASLYACACLVACTSSSAPAKLPAPPLAAVVASAASTSVPPVASASVVASALAERPCRPPPLPPSAANGQEPKRAFPGFERDKSKLKKKYDANADGRLDRGERDRARQALESARRSSGPGGAFPGPPPGADKRRGPFGELGEPAAGPRLQLSDIAPAPSGASLFAPATLRTLWIEFAQNDWEDELAAFHDTDVEVPAKLVVDGVPRQDVGVRFRGMSSFGMVPKGFKRSLAISVDAFAPKQTLLGARSLNLLNAAHDPTFMRSILALEIARHYLPAPKANHVRVVINGESWGVYVNAQQVNKDFVREWFGTTEGRWWKVPGSPQGRGNLAYLGENRESYEKIYELKSKDSPDAYRGLIKLCRVLEQSKPEALERELQPLLDVDEVLRFLALENLLINNDGYFLRTSDYYLYQNKSGRFVVIPHDVNETFDSLEVGPGSTGAQGVEVDPLMAANDERKPLISRLLAVPNLRAKYFAYLREMAETWLNWERLAPIVKAHQRAIANDVARDTKKLSRTEDFERGVTDNSTHQGPCGSSVSYGLKPFVEARRAYLLSNPSIQNADRTLLKSSPYGSSLDAKARH